MSADPPVFSSGASQDNVISPTLGAGSFGCEAAGGFESVEVSEATDWDEAADEDVTPTLPHAARATVTTSVASQRVATINQSQHSRHETSQRADQRLCPNVSTTLRCGYDDDAARMSTRPATALARKSVTPVSYTHLDVYKRQHKEILTIHLRREHCQADDWRTRGVASDA